MNNKDIGAYYGPSSFKIQYPKREGEGEGEGTLYENNENMKWCVHLNLPLSSELPMEISITFDYFQLEKGFDRLVIKHFNQSFEDPPMVFTGGFFFVLCFLFIFFFLRKILRKKRKIAFFFQRAKYTTSSIFPYPTQRI